MTPRKWESSKTYRDPTERSITVIQGTTCISYGKGVSRAYPRNIRMTSIRKITALHVLTGQPLEREQQYVTPVQLGPCTTRDGAGAIDQLPTNRAMRLLSCPTKLGQPPNKEQRDTTLVPPRPIFFCCA
jgi:hypothetical protein